jgi:hypothetical protein
MGAQTCPGVVCCITQQNLAPSVAENNTNNFSLLEKRTSMTVASCNNLGPRPDHEAMKKSIHFSHLSTPQHCGTPFERSGPTETSTRGGVMSSLRDTIETTYAAASFAERNLKSEAQEYLETASTGKEQADKVRTKPVANRPRPSMKA